MSLRNRIERLERAPALLGHGRRVIVCPSEHANELPGSIARIDATTWHLYVPEAEGLDPLSGLSPRQRAFVEPTDRFIVLIYGTDENDALVVGTPSL